MKKRTLTSLITCFILIILTLWQYNQLNNILISEEALYDIANPNTRENEYTLYLDSNKNLIEKPKEVEKENIKLNALYAALIDGDSGRVLYEKEGYSQNPMASTTKIMTCIVALENSNFDEVVTVSKRASTMPDVKLNIKEDEQYYMKDMLYALMLESHNDVAVAIAEHIAGSEEAFAVMMNQKARQLSCKNTNFVTPNGLDAENHYTTAVEMARIASYAIKNHDFITITNADNWTFNELTNGRSFMVSNKDKFLYMYDGAIGVKTGFTNNAGYCFVGAVKKNDKTFVSTVLASGWPPHRNYKWRDTIKLMDYGSSTFDKYDIFYHHIFKPLYVEKGQEKITGLHYNDEIQVLFSPHDVIKISFYTPKQLEAPIDKNTIVGKAIYYVNDQIIKEVPILTSNDVAEIDFSYCMDKIISLWTNKLLI